MSCGSSCRFLTHQPDSRLQKLHINGYLMFSVLLSVWTSQLLAITFIQLLTNALHGDALLYSWYVHTYVDSFPSTAAWKGVSCRFVALIRERLSRHFERGLWVSLFRSVCLCSMCVNGLFDDGGSATYQDCRLLVKPDFQSDPFHEIH